MSALIIAWNTIRLCLRSWVLYLVLAVTLVVVFVLGGVVAAIPKEWMMQAEQFDDQKHPGLSPKVHEELNDQEYRVVMAATARDVGFLYILAPGGVLAAVLLATLFNEAQRSTTHTLASRPIRRGSILLAGFLSASCLTLLVVAFVALDVWLLGLALLHESSWRVFAGAAILCVAFLAVAAWTTCFSTLINPIAAAPIALLHAAAGWRSVMIRQFLDKLTEQAAQTPDATGPTNLLADFARIGYWLVPHYQDTHELAKAVHLGEKIDPTTLHSLYLSLIHIVVALAIATLVFRRRDL